MRINVIQLRKKQRRNTYKNIWERSKENTQNQTDTGGGVQKQHQTYKDKNKNYDKLSHKNEKQKHKQCLTKQHDKSIGESIIEPSPITQ